LYDVTGNAWELCWDWHNSNVKLNDDAYGTGGNVTNPLGAATGTERVMRGGGWFHTVGQCEVAYRTKLHPNGMDESVGFRVVLSQ
jgi:formylglycine-generating enzyme required for sulfatase activity